MLENFLIILITDKNPKNRVEFLLESAGIKRKQIQLKKIFDINLKSNDFVTHGIILENLLSDDTASALTAMSLIDTLNLGYVYVFGKRINEENNFNIVSSHFWDDKLDYENVLAEISDENVYGDYYVNLIDNLICSDPYTNEDGSFADESYGELQEENVIIMAKMLDSNVIYPEFNKK